tara:strand:- start:333 stop:1010 length:678 start_codon:yes stop_codon:yes gene_type:complete
MRIESKLCHFAENKIIVQVTGWINEKNVGSALAEGSTVEIAEDKAIKRLSIRLNSSNKIEFNSKINNNNIKIDNELKSDSKITLKANEDVNLYSEPNDWSSDLATIDLELKRLGWNRDNEIEFLKQHFGHNNRNKITRHKELLDYLNLLKNIDITVKTDLIPERQKKLIEESDIILKELSWDHNNGREYLQKEFNVSTRKDLDANQLVTFVSNLKEIRKQYLAKE